MHVGQKFFDGLHTGLTNVAVGIDKNLQLFEALENRGELSIGHAAVVNEDFVNSLFGLRQV